MNLFPHNLRSALGLGIFRCRILPELRRQKYFMFFFKLFPPTGCNVQSQKYKIQCLTPRGFSKKTKGFQFQSIVFDFVLNTESFFILKITFLNKGEIIESYVSILQNNLDFFINKEYMQVMFVFSTEIYVVFNQNNYQIYATQNKIQKKITSF